MISFSSNVPVGRCLVIISIFHLKAATRLKKKFINIINSVKYLRVLDNKNS